MAAPNAADDMVFDDITDSVDLTGGGDAAAVEVDATAADPGLLFPDLDANAPSGWDASIPAIEAGPPVGTRDAAAPRDAAPPTGTAGGTSGGGLIGGGGSSIGGTGSDSCNPDTCTNECSVSGPFKCCGLLGCGCTWAPGAYCI